MVEHHLICCHNSKRLMQTVAWMFYWASSARLDCDGLKIWNWTQLGSKSIFRVCVLNTFGFELLFCTVLGNTCCMWVCEQILTFLFIIHQPSKLQHTTQKQVNSKNVAVDQLSINSISPVNKKNMSLRQRAKIQRIWLWGKLGHLN